MNWSALRGLLRANNVFLAGARDALVIREYVILNATDDRCARWVPRRVWGLPSSHPVFVRNIDNAKDVDIPASVWNWDTEATTP